MNYDDVWNWIFFIDIFLILSEVSHTLIMYNLEPLLNESNKE